MLKAGCAREIITPKTGMPLCGYFSPRPNTGVLDDLFIRAVVFQQDRKIAGIVVFDLCLLSLEIINRIKDGLKAAELEFADDLIFSVTHTHTGPYANETYGVKADGEYIENLVEKSVNVIRRAYQNIVPVELFAGSENNNPLAFNRRYWMRDGKVLTNPGKLNPEIVKPEGTVDTEISVLAIKHNKHICAILANIVNHSDTIGGDLVSADWPGRLERAVQDSTGYDVPVLTLIGCSGNINHFDVASSDRQNSYAEACRIGSGYAQIVTDMLPRLKKLSEDKLQINVDRIEIPFRTLSQSQVEQAKEVLARIGDIPGGGAMTSEELVSGGGAAAKFFAEQLLEYQEKCSGKSREFPLLTLKFGQELALTTLPGEPFTEIGLEIKKLSPFPNTWPVTLAMGYCGYLPLPECFDRGGYEPLPVVDGSPAEDTALRLVKAVLMNLQ